MTVEAVKRRLADYRTHADGPIECPIVRLALAQPARSLDDLASDPSRLRRDEERNNGRDIAWLADSTQSRASQKHRINLVSVRHRPVTFGLNRPWEHGVHENLPRAKFRREAPGDDV